MNWKFCTVALAAVVFLTGAGCGKSDSPQGLKLPPGVDPKAAELGEQFARLLGEVKAKASDAPAFAALFADPKKAPKDLTPYKKYSFSLGQVPKVDGTKAKLCVEVGIPNMGDPLDTFWDFENVNGEWKISTAPLPRNLR